MLRWLSVKKKWSINGYDIFCQPNRGRFQGLTAVRVNIQDFFDCLTLKMKILYAQNISILNQLKPVGNG